MPRSLGRTLTRTARPARARVRPAVAVTLLAVWAAPALSEIRPLAEAETATADVAGPEDQPAEADTPPPEADAGDAGTDPAPGSASEAGAAAALPWSPGDGLDAFLQHIRAALRENRIDDARRLAEAGFEPFVGLAPYEYQAGRAQFHAGNFDAAMGHFDRAVMVEPGNLRYRVELGRARFAAQDFEGARSQFQRVLDADPPEQVVENVQRFLDLIERRLTGRRPSTSLWAEAGVGYDSNPLGALDDTLETELVLFGITFPQPVDFEAESDEFHFQEVGFSHRQPRTRTSAWQASARFQNRRYFNVRAADQQQTRLRMGPRWQPAEGHRRSLPVQLDHIRLDGDTFRTALSLAPEARIPLAPRTLLRVQGQIGYADHDDRDRNGLIGNFGVTAIRVLDEDAAWIGLAGLTVGRDQAASGQFRRNRAGALVGLQHTVRPGTRLGANLSLRYEHTSAGRDIQALFPDVSDDPERATTGRLAATARHDFGETGWTAFGEASYTDKNSNVELFEYDRREIFAGVRYEY